MSVPHAVAGAMIVCTHGTAATPLMPTGEGDLLIAGQIAATVKHTAPGCHYSTMGACMITGAPCAPAPAAPSWTNPISAWRIKGQEGLLSGARLGCVSGGIMYVAAPGQASLIVAENLARLRAEELAKIEAEIKALQRELINQNAGLALDVAGLADPTPISDGLSALNSLRTRDALGVGTSVLSMVPYVGDAIAKPGKTAKAIRRIQTLTRLLDNPHRIAKTAVALDAAARTQHFKALKVAITGWNAGGMVVNAAGLEEKRAEEREIKK